MVGWFKHDIPAWMDGTEALDDGPYRAYHVICQLIYLNEGPIALNEAGIAGRCKQHILAFRRNLRTLIDLKKLTLIDGRLANDRAATELQSVADHRATSAKGGRGSAGVAKGLRRGSDEVEARSQRDTSNNQLKDNSPATVPLSDPQHHKTRLEETRGDSKKDAAVAAPDLEVDLFRRGKEVLGKSAGGVIRQLLTAKDGKINLARAAIETAAGKQDPREYIGAIIRNHDPPPGEASRYVDPRL